MKCIICLLEKDSSDEHIFPQAIGGTLKTTRVCKTCNETFGQTADTTLTHHPLVQFATASARSDAELLARALGVGEMEDGTRLIPIKDSKTGALGARVEPFVQKSPDGKDVTAKFDGRDERHAKGVTRRWLADTGQEVPEEHFEAVFEGLVKRGQDVNPAARHRIALTPDHQDPCVFAHGLLKIAYELACRVIGDEWLDDPIAATMRQSLKGWPSNADTLVGNTSFMRSIKVPTADALPGRSDDDARGSCHRREQPGHSRRTHVERHGLRGRRLRKREQVRGVCLAPADRNSVSPARGNRRRVRGNDGRGSHPPPRHRVAGANRVAEAHHDP